MGGVLKLKQFRDPVYDRQEGYCCKCGLPLGDNWALHHRKLRSQGGKDELANLIGLHHSCHNLASDSVHLNPAESVANGFIVPAWADPEETLICAFGGIQIRLSNNGIAEIISTKER